MKTIKDLKAMIAQPASKDWFKKHGKNKPAGKLQALKTKMK